MHGHAMNNILDLFHDAAFITSERGTVQELNAAAQYLVNDGVVVLQAPDSRLSLQSDTADEELYREISQAHAEKKAETKPLSSIIRATGIGGFLLVSVFPVALPAHSPTDMAPPSSPRLQVLIGVRRRLQRLDDSTPRFALRFGLTPAETRLAKALKDGLKLREAAQVNKISYETARGHLRSIFWKADIKRQADLIRLILSFED